MILRMLPAPIIGSIMLLVFLLVMQWLIKYMPELVGKGIPIRVYAELISYNLAYMVVLAVPMSILIASLMSFAILVDNNAYSVIKASGVSFPQLVWPSILVGILFASGMWYFNNELLPQANYRANALWRDIRIAKPGFDLKPGVFYDGIDAYSIYVREMPPSNPGELRDVIIYDYTDGVRYRKDISARRGQLSSSSDGETLSMMLFDGEIHRRRPPGSDAANRYEKLTFSRHSLTISIEDLNFERSENNPGRRNDRTMRTTVMSHLLDSLQTVTELELAHIDTIFSTIGTGRVSESQFRKRITDSATFLPSPHTVSDTASVEAAAAATAAAVKAAIYNAAISIARRDLSRVDSRRADYAWARHITYTYRVEIHKKRSIAFACLIFMLIGAPLGLTIKRGGFGIAASIAIVLFLFYWVTLVNGEKLADRQEIEPWIGMWLGNIVTSILAMILILRVTMDRRSSR
jgi:lipopolysaccharide export system permease protein